MTLARNAEDQERLIALVRAALARMDAGEAVDPEALCAEHPHLAGPLGEVLGLTDALPGLQQQALREDPLAGLLLAERYQLATCLGRGAMGVVYRAEDRELRREVAVKILDARLFRDDQAEQRFQREAEALAALQHPNVVAVHDRGRTPEGIHFLVMELLDGSTLAALMADISAGDDPIAAVASVMGRQHGERHWPRLCARWAHDLATGLAVAHARGLVHRDVKPSNVFLARPGRPVLLDFGIAARATDERLTATQTTLGTPWYMAPEQVAVKSAGSAAPSLDVYGLGATLYHLLGGRPPYEGEAAAVLAALATRDPTPLAQVQPDLPRDLVAIVEKCLERDPRRRYPDANALARDLDAFLAHGPVSARPLGPMARRLRQWRRAPARPIAIAAIAIAMLIAAIAVPIWWQQQAERRQQDKQALYATLPSILAIEGWPDERVLRELRTEHQAAIDLLDRILALDPDDLPVRLWRASLQLDLGNRSAAIADLDVIAAQGDSAWFRELAARYAANDPTRSGTYAVDTSDMPTPGTPEELYVAGFHELRNRHLRGFAQRADALLAKAAESYLPARDLRLLSLAELGRIDELYDETIVLETIYGGDTARTQAMRGVALILQKKYEQSLAPLQRSLELRPERHGPHQNLGVAFLNLGRLDEAEHHFLTAQRLRPFAWNTGQGLAQTASCRGDFERAYLLAEQLSKTGVRGEAWKQPELVGSIALEEAMHWRDEDPERRMAAARRAAASYRESLAVRDERRTRQRLAIAEALAKERYTGNLVAFTREMLADPDDSYQLGNLAFLMANEGLDREQTAWVAAILRQLAIQRASGNEALRQRLRAEIDEGLRQFR